MGNQSLATHGSPFVSIRELATYWLVSPRYVRRQIKSGALVAIRLGPRLYRIPVSAALSFEQRLTMPAPAIDRPSTSAAPRGSLTLRVNRSQR